ncbi:MFS transporter [Xylaria intraflava]|nr:MFS transporter [Xylaria intraflava]
MFGTGISANPLKLDVRSHIKCILICLVITLSAFQAGLDNSLISGFLAMPGFLKVYGYYDDELESWNIDPTVQQLITGLMTAGSFSSAMLVGPFSSRFGRKYGMWAASVFNLIAAIIMMKTTDLGSLYFARFLLGFSVGWFIPFSQLYVQEVAPAHLRGIMFAIYQCELSFASVVGTIVDYGTHNIESRLSYRIPLSIFFLVPATQLIALFFYPESPRWLAVQGRETESWEALRRLRNSEIDETELLAEFNEIKQSTHEQVELSKKALFLEIWQGTNLRRTLLSISSLCFIGAAGSSWVGAYETYYLTIAKVSDPFGFSILVASAAFIFALLSALFLRYIDRRVLVMSLALTCSFAHLVPAIAWTISPGSMASARVAVAFNVLFIVCVSIYLPCLYLLGGEFPNSALRGYAFGVANMFKYAANFLGNFTAPYFINPASLNWGPKYGYIWFSSNVTVATFAYFFLPETRDRTLEELHEMFENKVPARKFKTYVCVGVEGYAAEVRKETGQQEEKVILERAESSGMNSLATTVKAL